METLFSLSGLDQPHFLPMTKAEMNHLGWKELDVLLISGDAYVDHPSFAMALLGRTLVAHGFRTGIIAQPAWTSTDDLLSLGRPRLFAGISAGAMDSMLAHYTAFRKKRSNDAYTPGGKAGVRPNRATIVYANLIRQAFPGLPLVLGGIEASLRRITHYDFWTDKLRKPILLDAKADLLVYGMGERAIVQIARHLATDQDIHSIAGTVWADLAPKHPVLDLPSHEELEADKKLLMRATLMLEAQVHNQSNTLRQQVGTRSIYLAPPAAPLTTVEIDQLYALPFARSSHPLHKAPIPAEEMIRDSVTSHRGCGGGCSFCTLALHQGRRIASRSQQSILAEIQNMAQRPSFKGTISDVGGPSANMWGAVCAKPSQTCKRASCMTPSICPHFHMDQAAHLKLLRAVRDTAKVRHVRVASGIRFDLALKDKSSLSGFLQEFVGGQLKIAPEHICNSVLALMRKPKLHVFEEFLTIFTRQSAQAGKKQYVVPYLMSAFPGTTDKDMHRLQTWLRARGWQPRQVQCFIPIPGAVATAMFYAGITPQGKPIYVARTDADRLRQHRILMPKNNLPKRSQAPKSKRPLTPPSKGKRPRPH